MELIQGVPITEFCDNRKLEKRELLQLLQEVCSAVQHALKSSVPVASQSSIPLQYPSLEILSGKFSTNRPGV